MRESLQQRLARLSEHGNHLAAMPGTPEPTAVHVAAIDVLTDLMRMGQEMSSSDTPMALRAMMTTLDRSKGLLLERLTTIPPAQVKAFMADLIDRMQVIVDTPIEGEGAASDHDTPDPAAAADADRAAAAAS